jgi:hypothetical protein
MYAIVWWENESDSTEDLYMWGPHKQPNSLLAGNFGLLLFELRISSLDVTPLPFVYSWSISVVELEGLKSGSKECTPRMIEGMKFTKKMQHDDEVLCME